MSRFMNSRSDDVRRCLAGKLNDVLTKIRFESFDALSFKCRVQMYLFRRHALTLDDEPRPALARECFDQVISFGRIARPMYPGSGLFRIRSELCRRLVQMKQRHVFDATSLRSEIFPIVETAGSCQPAFAEK